MIAAALADNIIGRHAAAIRRDAEALLAVAAAPDLPAGMAMPPTSPGWSTAWSRNCGRRRSAGGGGDLGLAEAGEGG